MFDNLVNHCSTRRFCFHCNVYIEQAVSSIVGKDTEYMIVKFTHIYGFMVRTVLHTEGTVIIGWWISSTAESVGFQVQ